MPNNPFSRDEETGEYKNQGRFANAMRGMRDGGLVGAIGGAVEKPKGRLFAAQQGQGNKYGLGDYGARLDAGIPELLPDIQQPKFGRAKDKAMKFFTGGFG